MPVKKAKTWRVYSSLLAVAISRVSLFGGLLLAISGCGETHYQDWQVRELIFTNRVIKVFWEGTIKVDQIGKLDKLLGSSNHAFKVIKRNFICSQIDLNSLTCIEHLISGGEFTNVVTSRKERELRFTPNNLPEDTFFVNADFDGNHLLLRRGFSPIITVTSPTETNAFEGIRPFKSGRGAVNERGDCVFVPLGSGGDGKTIKETPFAVHEKGVWWTSRIEGGMPSVDATIFSRTSAVPALINVSADP